MFSRPTYDKCAYQQNLESSEGPGRYVLNSPIDVPCLVYEPEGGSALAGGSHAAYAKLVDVNSELMGITNPYSKCKRKYDCGNDQSVQYQRCRVQLHSESTRMSNPPCTLRCNGVNRWETLCKNPQETAMRPFDTLVNNRLIVKDTHRPCVELPKDQSSSLPPENNMNVVTMSQSFPIKERSELLPQSYAAKCDASYFGEL